MGITLGIEECSGHGAATPWLAPTGHARAGRVARDCGGVMKKGDQVAGRGGFFPGKIGKTLGNTWLNHS